MNALYEAEINWIGDRKEGASCEVNDSDESGQSVVVIHGGPRGTPFHIRMDNTVPKDYYFNVHWVPERDTNNSSNRCSCSLSIGVVTPSQFIGGWKTKGMFYNGNLTSGGAALAISWGPRFGPGDTIGVRVVQGDERVQVVFYLNGLCLGTGFSLSGNPNVYYPCIHIDGDATLKIDIPKDLPSTDLQQNTPTSVSGQWKLMEAVEESGEQLTIPSTPVKLEVIRKEDMLKFHFKAGNPLNGSAKILQENRNALQIEMGNLMSGRMMPPPEFLKIERLLCSMKPDTLKLEEGNQLMLARDSMRTVWVYMPREPLTLSNYH